MGRFESKVAIVTGGASGIGRAICTQLAEKGTTVIAADINLEGAKETAKCIRKEGGVAEAVSLNVTDYDVIVNLFQRVKAQYGRIDYLFNNAGTSVNGEFQDISQELWQRVIDVNLWGVVYGCQAVYPIMQTQGFGHIINTASLAGLIPGGLTSAYSTSKHAVVGLSTTLRSEAKEYGIQVSVFCPGVVQTPILHTSPNVTDYMNHPDNLARNEKMNLPTPDQVVRPMLRDVLRNKGIILHPFKHRLYWWVHRAFPEFIPNMFHQVVRSLKKTAGV